MHVGMTALESHQLLCVISLGDLLLLAVNMTGTSKKAKQFPPPPPLGTRVAWPKDQPEKYFPSSPVKSVQLTG